jgi:C-terminal processing protease CtpA/Prc
MRSMLSSLKDPYTRFLSPAEFASLSKYDITGVGLNIVDAPDSGSGIKVRAGYIDDKVANREIRVWHFVIENGY